MLDIILDSGLDSILDSVKLFPFLLITYLILEFLEHKTGDKTQKIIKKSNKFGPLLGSILGIFPQCGFSTAASNFYAGRIISLGTLIAVFLSTSDEMLPILISEKAPISLIIKILLIKLIIGIIAGFIIDLCMSLFKKKKDEKIDIDHICEHEHCHCENGIFKSALKHSLHIFIYILIITFVLNIFIGLIGEETISGFISTNHILGPIIASLIGLIPNCASSVIITELYLEEVLNLSTMISGLLVNAGVGLLVLFRVNKNIKENILIIILLYAIGVISGFLLGLVI